MPSSGYPAGPLVGGTTARSPILQNYVFQSGIQDIEHSKILTYKYPQYYMTALLDKLGASEPVARDVFSWSIQDRTRQSATYTAIANGTTAAATLTLDTPASGANLGYYIVGDVIRIAKTGALGVVTTVGNAGGFQTIIVARPDGSNWNTTVLPAVTSADTIGHVFSAFGEGTNGAETRLFLPVEDENFTQIIKRGMKVSGSEMSNRTILGDGKAWYFEVENILMKEFARDREILIMFGQKANANGIKWSRGILDFVTTGGGILTTYASNPGVTEADLQAHIQKLVREGGSSEYLVLVGSKFLSDVMNTLKDYKIHGSTPDSLGSRMAGLDFAGYSFAGKTIYFAYYELFDDPAVLPFVGTPTASAINFRDFSLWLDMGTDSGGRNLITLKYKAHNGAQRKFIHKIIPGMMTFDGSGEEGGFAANSFDGLEVQLLSEIGLELRLPNRHGILRANS